MATHSSTLAWKIPWTEEPGRLQSMGSLRVRHNRATSLSLFTFVHWRKKWHSSVPAWRIPGMWGAWWAAIYGVAQSRTRLKRLSSSSSSRLDLLSVQGTLKNLLEHHSSKASILLCSYFFIVQLLVVHTHIFTLF